MAECPRDCPCACHGKTVIIGAVPRYSKGHSPEADRHYDEAARRIKAMKAKIEKRYRG